jgi:hypothetical protein
LQKRLRFLTHTRAGPLTFANAFLASTPLLTLGAGKDTLPDIATCATTSMIGVVLRP